MTSFPEALSPFHLYAPDPENGEDTWGMADGGGWIPVRLADRDACLMLAGVLLGGADFAVTEQLRDLHNRATPSVGVTIEHIIAHLHEPELGEGEEP